MLAECELMAFVPVSDQARANDFYHGKLGLKLVSQDGFAAVFDANGIVLRVTTVPPPFHPQPFTILGWNVADIASEIRSLESVGVKFERYPALSQDELGIWSAPGGAKIAWFRDPDGNTLSLTQF